MTPNDTLAPRRAGALLLASAALAAACRSTEATPSTAGERASGGAGSAATAEFGPDVGGVMPVARGAAEPDPIGFVISGLDVRLRAWSNLKLEGADAQAARSRLALLEEHLRQEVEKHQSELVEQLQTGPDRNRAVAAGALGFGRRADVEGPLLAALEDRDVDVVRHALLSLGNLGAPETPLAQICFLARRHPDGWVRNNATFAIGRTVAAGNRDACAAEAGRAGLVDPEAGVRAQAAALLGALADAESLPQLASLLDDEVALVGGAAARSLSAIGQAAPERKGDAARALVAAFERADGARRDVLRLELARLAGEDRGSRAADWREWAYRLP
jgi:hypothetical protein